MVDLEAAVTHLYEDESLTAELDDPEATALLKWAEAQIERLVAQYPSEDDYDAHYTPLRAFVKRLNKVVGQRADMDAEERLEMLTRMADTARSLGGQVDDAGIQAAAAALPSLDGQGALHALLAWTQPATAASALSDAPVAAPETPVPLDLPPAPDSPMMPTEYLLAAEVPPAPDEPGTSPSGAAPSGFAGDRFADDLWTFPLHDEHDAHVEDIDDGETPSENDENDDDDLNTPMA
jgi:hypothetical protein